MSIVIWTLALHGAKNKGDHRNIDKGKFMLPKTQSSEMEAQNSGILMFPFKVALTLLSLRRSD